MLTFFRTNQPLANIFLLVYLGIVRLSTFIHPLSIVPKSQGVLTQWMYADLNPVSIWGNLAAFFLVFFQAVFINITMSRYRVSSEINLLPGLFYCLVTSIIPDFLTLSSALLANTFLILALFYLFEVYKSSYVAPRIFDVGFWIGIASLFHFSYILFVLCGIIGLGILRGLRVKEFFIFLIGVFVPFFLFGVYLFWHDKLVYLPKHFSDNLSFFNFVQYNNPAIYLKIGIMALLIGISLLVNGQISSKRSISTQKFLSCIYWVLLIGGMTTFFQAGVDINHLLVISVPLGILLSMLFQRIGVATSEVFHTLLMSIALIFQFEYLLAA